MQVLEVKRAAAYGAGAIAIAAFIAAVVLAYIGAITDDVHVWQCWFVTALLTVVSALVAFGAWPL